MYCIRSAIISRIVRNTNEKIRTRIKAEEMTMKRSMKWFGHLMRMPEER